MSTGKICKKLFAIAAVLGVSLLQTALASATTYQYSYSNVLPIYDPNNEFGYNHPIHLSVVINSPTPFLFSQDNQGLALGLTATATDGYYRRMAYDRGILTVTASHDQSFTHTYDFGALGLYFFSPSPTDSRLPGNWLITLGSPLTDLTFGTQNSYYGERLDQLDWAFIGGPIYSATANAPGSWSYEELPDPVAVPEPATLLLLAAGGAAGFIARRRSQS